MSESGKAVFLSYASQDARVPRAVLSLEFGVWSSGNPQSSRYARGLEFGVWRLGFGNPQSAIRNPQFR
jgi:hypothetical protein